MPKKTKKALSLINKTAGGFAGSVVGAICGPAAAIGYLFLEGAKDPFIAASLTFPLTTGLTVMTMVPLGVINGGLRGGQVGAYYGITDHSEVPKELFRYDIVKGENCFFGEIYMDREPSPVGTNFCTFWSESAKKMRKAEKHGEAVQDNSECKIKQNKMG